MVKVETKEFEDKGIIAIAFEASRDEDLDTLDIIRVAMLGEHPKQGGYASSHRLVVHVKKELEEQSKE
jgi:hypothetical protein